MAKKANVFANTQIKTLKKELIGVVDYLQSLKLDSLVDDVDWKATATGKVMPAIISTVEKQIKTCVGSIRQSVTMIKAVYEADGLSEELEYQIDETTKKLEELQDHYYRQPISGIEHRKLEFQIGVTKKGDPKMMSIVAASKDDQIQARNRIIEDIAKIIPLLATVQSYTTTEVRGGKAMDESMELFLARKQNSVNNVD